MSEHGTMQSAPVATVGVAVALAAVHLFSYRLGLTERFPRSRWLSISGGASVAYVFVHVLPEVARVATHLRLPRSEVGFLERHVYLVALLGFLAYYGVERFAERRGSDEHPASVFWFHVGAFGVYNLLVGYLLVQREESGVLLFGVAMVLHFFVNDQGLWRHHGRAYRSGGRWLLAGAVLAGTGVGFLVDLPQVVTAALFAFLAGGIILNVIKEEVPEEQESRFAAFALGAIVYTAVLLLA